MRRTFVAADAAHVDGYAPAARVRHPRKTMVFRILFAPITLLLRLLLSPIRAMRRARAASPGALLELRLKGRIHEGPSRPRKWWPPRLVLAPKETIGVRIVALRKLIDEAPPDARVAG